MKLETKLTVFFSSAFIILITIFTAIIYFQSAEILRTEKISLMESRVSNIIKSLALSLSNSLHEIKIISSDPWLSSEDSTPDEITKRLIFYRNTCEKYVSFSFFNLNRIRIADTAGLSIGEQDPLSPFWEDILRKGVSIAGDVHVEEPFQTPIAYIASLIKNKEGKDIGVVVGRILTNRFFDISHQMSEIKEEKIDIVNKKGLLIYSNHNQKGLLKDNLLELESVGKTTNNTPIGSSVQKHINEGWFIQSHCYEKGYWEFKGNEWRIFIHIPESIVFSSLYTLLAKLILTLLVILPIVMLVISFFSKKITRPLALLATAADEIAQGRLDISIKIQSKDEVGWLCTSFNKMANNLRISQKKERDLYLTLEEKVHERTEKLKKLQKGTLNILEDLKESKDLLEKSKQYFLNIVDKSSEGILVTDKNGIIQYANFFAAHIFNKNREEFIGQNFGRPIITGEKTEIDIIFKKGEIGTGEILATTTKWENKEAYLIFIRDITDRKKKEEQLKRALNIKTNFTNMVSHELRTPLTCIKESISIVLDKTVGSINSEQQKSLDIAIRNVNRISRLINHILDFHSFESDKMKLRMEENDINEIANEVWQTMFFSAKKKNLSFVCQLESDLPKIFFDRDKITDVLTNLVHNAIKFTEKGSITISFSKNNNYIQVKVEDTGIGMKEEKIKKIFNEFTQIEGTSGGGSGLGLFLCKKIIDEHKGQIWATSEFTKGSAFYFTIPL